MTASRTASTSRYKTKVVQIGHHRVLQGHDNRATSGLHLDETLALQPAQRLAHRGGRDPEMLRQGNLPQAVPGRADPT